MSLYVLFNILAATYLTVVAFMTLKRLGYTMIDFFKLAIGMITAFFIGSRMLYGLLYFEKIAQNPYKLIAFELKNFALFGGLVLSGCVLWVFIKWNKNPRNLFQITDPMMPHFGIAVILSKLGCFFNGCCYGIPTQMPWGVVFERADQSVINRMFGNTLISSLLNNEAVVHRHPTQLYEVFFTLLAIGITVIILRRHKRLGIATAAFILIFTVGRWISFALRDFPNASDLSNFIRGPLIYGSVIFLVLIGLYLSRNKVD